MALVLSLLCISLLYPAKGYIVDSVNGNDNNDGETINDPFKTITKCVEVLKDPGDECQIRSGYYHEVVTINKLQGTQDAPFKIVGYEDERPIWDGTVAIQPTEWAFDSDTKICSAPIDQDILALFYKNDLLTSARWPNAKWSDKSIFDNKFWRPCPDSERGTIVDDALADANLNFTGSMAILNIGSWETYVAEVESHTPGNNNFTYNDDFGNIHFKHQQYYLEASLELLDSPEEWFYDMGTKMLYLIMPENTEKKDNCPDSDSSEGILRGRTLDNVVEFEDCKDVIVANITFWASNIVAKGNCQRMKFDSLIFNFPSSSHRMLKSAEEPKVTNIHGDDNAVVNCTFLGADGPPLIFKGENMLVHNSEFLFNDWAGQGNLGTVKDDSQGRPAEISQNTYYYNGVAHGHRVFGMGPNFTLNHMIGQCWGFIQNDGASISVGREGQEGVMITNNWIHDSPKKGIRLDSPTDVDPDEMGCCGYLGFNVVWNSESQETYPKGDNHTVSNNVGWDDHDNKCTICVPCEAFDVPMNSHSTVVNNGASKLDCGGAVVENNYESEEVKEQMVDTDNYDFRPIAGGGFIPPDGGDLIGAYGFEIATYWIPGRKLFKASFPIPKDGSVISANRNDVICQTGYMAEGHDFYFGETFEEVDSARKGDDTFLITLYGDENIFATPALQPDMEYFWRVDAFRGGNVYKGDVWSFETA